MKILGVIASAETFVMVFRRRMRKVSECGVLIVSMRWTEEQYTEYLRKNNKLPGQGLILKPVKKSKYNANRVRVDGILFDSQLEADYYSDLKLQLKMGTIKGFCRQPEFVLQEGLGDIRPITYRPDFIVFHNDGSYEIVDTKGFETQEFKRTRKLFKARFPGLELKVVKRGDLTGG